MNNRDEAGDDRSGAPSSVFEGGAFSLAPVRADRELQIDIVDGQKARFKLQTSYKLKIHHDRGEL
jgi:hypothetical protein